MALIRLYEELNDYLPEDKRKQDICISVQETSTVRSILSYLKVPIGEVDLVLVNGRAVNADQGIKKNDRISVYPVFERFNIQNVTRVRSRPLRRPRFITDVGLIELAHELSALGWDVIRNDSGIQSDMIQCAQKEKRIILTLDRKIEKKQSVTRVMVLKTGTTDHMVQEIRMNLNL